MFHQYKYTTLAQKKIQIIQSRFEVFELCLNHIANNEMKVPQHLLQGGKIPLNIAPAYHVYKLENEYLFKPVDILSKQPRTLPSSLEFDPMQQFYSQYPSYITHSRTDFKPYTTTFRKPKKLSSLSSSSTSSSLFNNDDIGNPAATTRDTVVDDKENSFNSPIWNEKSFYQTLSLFRANLWEYGGFAVSMNDIPNDIDLQLSSNFGEVCFGGKSNVGKSSLVNCVMNSDRENAGKLSINKETGKREIKVRDFHSGLAVVSSKPGRTRMLNFYSLDFYLSLVDCMGYGKANVDEKIQQYWLKFMKEYFITRLDNHLKHIFILIDCSQIDWNLCLKNCINNTTKNNGEIDLTNICTNTIKSNDWQMFDFLDACFVPFSLVVTKIDCIDGGTRLSKQNDTNSEESFVDFMHDKYKYSWKFKLLINEIEKVYKRYAMIQPFLNVTSSRLGFGITELQCLMGQLTGYFDNTNKDDPIPALSNAFGSLGSR